METFFEKKFINDEVKILLKDKNINVVTFNTKSSRKIEKNLFKKYTNNVVFYEITYNSVSDDFYVNKQFNKKYRLTTQSTELFNTLDKSTPLIIDITNIDIRVLGVFLFNLKKLKFSCVVCLYITPLKYVKNPKYLEQDDEEDNQFDLYNGIGIKRGINGYLVDNDNNLLEKNIILLGFEGDRVRRLCEEGNIDVPIPVITLPAIKPGWQNYALVANKDVLKKLPSRTSVEYIAADSIISIYNKMNEWKNAYSENFLRISPLGTKVNALGVLLYVLTNPKSFDILYDNPEERKSNTIGADNYLYYDITEYLL